MTQEMRDFRRAQRERREKRERQIRNRVFVMGIIVGILLTVFVPKTYNWLHHQYVLHHHFGHYGPVYGHLYERVGTGDDDVIVHEYLIGSEWVWDCTECDGNHADSEE